MTFRFDMPRNRVHLHGKCISKVIRIDVKRSLRTRQSQFTARLSRHDLCNGVPDDDASFLNLLLGQACSYADLEFRLHLSTTNALVDQDRLEPCYHDTVGKGLQNGGQSLFIHVEVHCSPAIPHQHIPARHGPGPLETYAVTAQCLA